MTANSHQINDIPIHPNEKEIILNMTFHTFLIVTL